MAESLVAGLGDRRPTIAPDAFLAAGCAVLGSARIGAGASIWYGTVVRADFDEIGVGAQANLQDGAVVHADPGLPGAYRRPRHGRSARPSGSGSR